MSIEEIYERFHCVQKQSPDGTLVIEMWSGNYLLTEIKCEPDHFSGRVFGHSFEGQTLSMAVSKFSDLLQLFGSSSPQPALNSRPRAALPLAETLAMFSERGR